MEDAMARRRRFSVAPAPAHGGGKVYDNRRFDSVEDMARFADGTVSQWGNTKEREREPGFCDHTFSETMNHAINGWPEGRAKLQHVVSTIAGSNYIQPKSVETTDVAGAYPIVPLAVAGDPFCMVDLRPDEKRMRPVLLIRVGLGQLAVWNENKIHNYGGALLSWIDHLESSGFRVHLDGYFYSIDIGDSPGVAARQTHVAFVTVKNASEHVDMDRMAFALIHPGFHRRIDFVVKEACAGLHDWRSSYGCTSHINSAMIEALATKGGVFAEFNEPNALWIAGKDTDALSQCDTPLGALRVVRKQIMKAMEPAGLQVEMPEV
jgi:hypothetical protein